MRGSVWICPLCVAQRGPHPRCAPSAGTSRSRSWPTGRSSTARPSFARLASRFGSVLPLLRVSGSASWGPQRGGEISRTRRSPLPPDSPTERSSPSAAGGWGPCRHPWRRPAAPGSRRAKRRAPAIRIGRHLRCEPAAVRAWFVGQGDDDLGAWLRRHPSIPTGGRGGAAAGGAVGRARRPVEPQPDHGVGLCRAAGQLHDWRFGGAGRGRLRQHPAGQRARHERAALHHPTRPIQVS